MSMECCGEKGCFRPVWDFILGKQTENTPLRVIGIDPRIVENRTAHPDTDLVILIRGGSKVGLVIPRGWDFFLKLYFNRDYNPKIDKIYILMKLNETSVITSVRNPDEDVNNDWPVSLISLDKRTMKVKLASPVNAKVGEWTVNAAVERIESGQPLKSFRLNMPLHIVEDTSVLGNGPSSRGSTLEVLQVDPCIVENGVAHKTAKYEIMNRGPAGSKLVVRRNEDFHLRLNLNRNYDSLEDVIVIIVSLDGTIDKSRSIKLGEPRTEGWQVILEDSGPKFVRIKVTSPSNAAIGKWNMEIETMKNSAPDLKLKSIFDGPIYMIFNPWCADDTVFMKNENERQEYVMLETGLIWNGTHDDMKDAVWEFSQFDKNILDCALDLVTDISKISPEDRGNPILVSRGLAAAVNYDDRDKGVLVGNWEDDFTGGTPPSTWIGSGKILQKYYETKSPVKFGQCWVYGGVLATVCRTLGLPCRVVTNFKSAHDTQNDLTLDLVLDANDFLTEERTLKGDDSIWNFHVWNEVWMERLDLGSLYGGWQAIDATPQELSEGAYTCGPSSVAAIKRGDLHLAFDNRFVFSEVNADILYWRYNGPDQPEKFLRKEIYGVGLNISTKAVGRWERNDITDTYKNPDNSIEDREAMMTAFRRIERPYIANTPAEFSDITFKIDLNNNVFVGTSVSVVLSMNNQSSFNTYNINTIMLLEITSYTKKSCVIVKRNKTNLTMEPGKIEQVNLAVPWEEYGSKISGHSAFNLICIATVENTNFEYVDNKEFRLLKPKINIEILSEALVGEVLEVKASFINPLPIPLENGKFIIQGPGLNQQMKIKLSEKVGAGQEARCQFSMTPKFKGEGAVIVKFHSEQIDDVDGFLPIFVRYG